MDWILSLGGNKENLRYRDHEKEELSFYSKAQQILNTSSRGDGVSSGALRTVPITI
jgi:glycyl-tRNA synthetase (class II)